MLKKLNFEIFRIIAAILVVAIHTYPFATINEEFDFLFTHVLCRIAVPLFLMITGYYAVQKGISDKKYMLTYTKKIAILYGICIILYLPVNIYTGTFQHMTVLDSIKWLFLNGTFYHLWYFPSLIIGIWVLYFLLRHTKECFLQILLIFFYLIGLLGDSYYGISINFPFLKQFYDIIFSIFEYTRNGLFYVTIFLYLGYYFSKIKWKVSTKTNIVMLLYFIVFLEIEGFLLHQFSLQRHDSMYILLIPVMIFLFPLLLKYKGTANKKLRNLATIIYIIHPLMIILVRGIAKVIHLETYLVYNNLLHFIVVVWLSVLFGIFLERIREKTKMANLLHE